MRRPCGSKCATFEVIYACGVLAITRENWALEIDMIVCATSQYACVVRCSNRRWAHVVGTGVKAVHGEEG